MKVAIRSIFPSEAEGQLKAEYFSGNSRGYFVDVGANAPRDGSQTWELEQQGWTGILVEPQPDLANRSRSERRAQVYGAACSTPENAGRRLTLYLAGIQKSLDPDFYVAGVQRSGTCEVPIMTLDEVLRDAKAPRPLDFVSIDVEGHDVEVLAGFDLAYWQPRLVLIEDVVHSLRLHRHIVSRGYRWVRRTGINSWYIPTGTAFQLSAIGRVQFFRKYYFALPFRILREWKRRLMRQ